MSEVLAIMKKDTLDMFKKGRIFLILLFSIVFSTFLISLLSDSSPILSIGKKQVMIDTLITVFLLALTFIVISIFCEVLFLEERVSGSYEALFTTPLNIGQIITGKALASFAFSYVMAITAVTGMLISLFINRSLFLIPSILGFVGVFVSIPFFSFSFVRLYGTLMFSIKNIQNLYVFRYIFIFGGIFGISKSIPIILKYTTPEYLVFGINVTLLITGTIILIITNILISKISNEEILMRCQ